MKECYPSRIWEGTWDKGFKFNCAQRSYILKNIQRISQISLPNSVPLLPSRQSDQNAWPNRLVHYLYDNCTIFSVLATVLVTTRVFKLQDDGTSLRTLRSSCGRISWSLPVLPITFDCCLFALENCEYEALCVLHQLPWQLVAAEVAWLRSSGLDGRSWAMCRSRQPYPMAIIY